MAGVAMLAREQGHRVSGCDANVYPPMSDQLAEAGITVMQGYDPAHLACEPDVVVIGNALSRGNALVERVLEDDRVYLSGPEWLRENVLKDRHVLAIAGTHGKTTTSSMLAWLLEAAEHKPGFLIGGIPANFGVSARLGEGKYFVIEADEYDTAFFDKRSKFVHYRPRTLVINNLEFDHADIFPDLAAIQRQFHHLIRTVPGSGRILCPYAEPVVAETIAMGAWSHIEHFAINNPDADWFATLEVGDGSSFRINHSRAAHWALKGTHNVSNALAATAAAASIGLGVDECVSALEAFKGVKRRLELVGERRGARIYDDFAHHPTAIETTLAGIRASNCAGRVIAVIEPRSNTMRMGAHRDRLPHCVDSADAVMWYQPSGVDWDLGSVVAQSSVPSVVYRSTEEIIQALVADIRDGDQVVIMSNGGFEGIHQRLVQALD